jgi:nucleoside-diphosphate-sugar epimerase
MNASVPTLVASHFQDARIVVFSTGNVYPVTAIDMGGSTEEDPVEPVGDYAMSCLARERIFGWYSTRGGSRALLFRLNYAVDLRYGVLVDIALKVLRGEPVDLTMGHVNVIWQGDANACAIAALALADAPPAVLNVTGVRTLSVREVALRFAELLGRSTLLVGTEMKSALLSNSSRMQKLLGSPLVDEETLIEWVASWISRGGDLLSKPTHFEERSGRF